ncbi:hypothetical protein [Paraburkholderia saeva]|uniref:hypothetical protein n=1 Tax=Paraburkholderia saeva TaxID=2777537 RepID=UPI001E4C3887|nr:hypothetical protein [Paraburkholderia saeva]
MANVCVFFVWVFILLLRHKLSRKGILLSDRSLPYRQVTGIARFNAHLDPILNFLLDLGHAVAAQWNGLWESASGNVLSDGESALARSAPVAGQAGIATAESIQTIRGTDDFYWTVAFLVHYDASSAGGTQRCIRANFPPGRHQTTNRMNGALNFVHVFPVYFLDRI